VLIALLKRLAVPVPVIVMAATALFRFKRSRQQRDRSPGAQTEQGHPSAQG
jgi:hypothetical protein